MPVEIERPSADRLRIRLHLSLHQEVEATDFELSEEGPREGVIEGRERVARRPLGHAREVFSISVAGLDTV